MPLELLAEGDNRTQWVIYGMAALAIVYLVVRPLLKRKDPLESAASLSPARQRSVEREMQNLLVELSEMARQITAQLDTRSAKLEALLQEADQKLAELRKLSSESAAPPASSQAAAAATPSPALDPRHVEIYRLSDQGRSAQEIAQHLNRPRGEIELILHLRQD
jgi:heme exporter protein D